MDVRGPAVDAFEHLDIPVQWGDSDEGLTLDPSGVAVLLEVKRYSLVTEDLAQRMLRRPPPPGRTLLVVADRITEGAGTVLLSHGAGYLDLRGRLALRTDRVMISADVPAMGRSTERVDAISGRVGLEVAVAILMQPDVPVAVRQVARRLGRSPSTVSAVLAALRREGVLDTDNALTGNDLFWHVAGRWTTRRTYLATLPGLGQHSMTKALRLGLEDVTQPGWALTDSAAAVAYGAGVATRSDQVLDFFVPDQAVVRRASTLLGEVATPAQSRATVRVAPVSAAVSPRFETARNPFEWPLAHPLFVALDLAQDVGRGRNVLDAWTPGDQWARAW